VASPLNTKLRIAGSVLFATGFFDALAGRFLWQTGARPDAATPPDAAKDDPRRFTALRGALHVHTTYSDGASDVPTMMAEAEESGVDFVLLTDHNTQRPLRDGWEDRYPGGDGRPLLLIGTEVTVERGAFLLALDMPPEWEPTKGQPPQVAIDEVNARGGLPLVSLPFDIKHPWVAWDATGCAGLEVVNLSTVARRHINLPSLLWLIPLGRARGAVAALRALLTRPDASLERWDRLTDNGTRQVGIGALDAHALMKIGAKKYPIPSYADSMRALTTHVLIPEGTPFGAPARRAIYDALRAGRCYTAYDILGDPRPFSFTAANGTETAIMGEGIKRTGAVVLTARARTGTLLRVHHRGRVVAAGVGSVTHRATEPGAYRVEAYQYAFRVGPLFAGTRPWIFTNPIYVE
jgi:hypothetical protein